MQPGTRLVVSLAVALVVAGCGTDADEASAEAPDPADWDAVVEAARGQTVNLHMWGGGERINAFVDEFYARRLEDGYGVILNRVPVADTGDAVNTVLSELQAGRAEDGSVDMIWLNGENFATMRQADALLTDWACDLPNSDLLDSEADRVSTDFGLPVDCDESPLGTAQFQFVYDAARMDADELPRSYAELAEWVRDNPRRFTYIAPPAFTGTRFVKQALYELTGGHEQWAGEFDEARYDAEATALWRYLADLEPHLWREGQTYPPETADLDRLFANREVDITFVQSPAGVEGLIDTGQLPNTARPFLFETGTIADSHFLAIPVNASNPEGAMVLANLVLEPELQAAKLDPANGWGDGVIIDPDRLEGGERAAIDEVVERLGEAALSPAQLQERALPEVVPEYTTRLEEDWDRFIRRGEPLPEEG